MLSDERQHQKRRVVGIDAVFKRAVERLTAGVRPLSQSRYHSALAARNHV
jgi:hypothetical protein